MSEAPADAPSIRSEIERLQAAPAYNDAMNPRHADAVQAVQRQYQLLHPKDATPPRSAPRPDESALPIGNQIEFNVPSEIDGAALDAYGPADASDLANALHNAGGGGDGESIGQAVEWLQAIEAPAALASTVATQAAQITELPSAEQIDAAGVEAEQTLRDEWGPAYETKLRLANSLVGRLPADARTFLDRTGLSNNASLIRMLASTAEAQQRRAKA